MQRKEFYAIGLSCLLAPRYPCDLLLGGSSPRNHLAKKKKNARSSTNSAKKQKKKAKNKEFYFCLIKRNPIICTLVRLPFLFFFLSFCNLERKIINDMKKHKFKYLNNPKC